MPEQKDKVYQFASLSDYSLKQRVLIRLADRAFYFLIRIIGATIRFQTEGSEYVDAIASSGHKPIYATWHDRIFVGTYYLRDSGIIFLTSQSFDGEYIARFLRRLGFGAVRGSSTRGGSRALVDMIRLQKRGFAVGFTVDGPKGPRHVLKPGPVMVARKTGDPILPFIITPKRFFTVSSWDKLIIPMPFTRAVSIYGEPIYVPRDADNDVNEKKLSELQNGLESLEQRADDWRGSRG